MIGHALDPSLAELGVDDWRRTGFVLTNANVNGVANTVRWSMEIIPDITFYAIIIPSFIAVVVKPL